MKHNNAVFEVETTNHALVRIHQGYYIDAEGGVYKYNYSDYKPEPEHGRVGAVPLSVLSEQAALIEEASRGEIIETFVAYDAGSTEYLGYLFNPETQTRRRVLLYADGSSIRENTSPAARALTRWLQSVLEQRDSEHKPPDNRSIYEKVARILNLIATKPNLRNRPLENDLQGDFEQWFDGGAVRYVTGSIFYSFADGTSASVLVSNRLNVLITFRDDTEICVTEESLQEDVNISPNLSGFAASPPVPAIPSFTDLTSINAKFGARPKIWYCLFCGSLGGSAENNNVCQNCEAERPVFDTGITHANCRNCGQFNPLFALFCEWCGDNLKNQKL